MYDVLLTVAWYFQDKFDFSNFPFLIFVLVFLIFFPVYLLIIHKLNFLELVKNHTRFIWIIYGLYFAYFLHFATNPFLEGDAANIIAGSTQMAMGVESPLLYNYPVQPLAYKTLAVLFNFVHLDLKITSILLSNLCLLGVLFLGYVTVRKLKSENFAIAFTGINLLIHEILIEGVYFNTNIIAMFFLYCTGYIIITKRDSLISAVWASLCACIAFLFRMDIVLMLPILAWYLLFKKRYQFLIISAALLPLTVLLIAFLLRIDILSAFSVSKNHFGAASFPFLYIFTAMPLSIFILSFYGFIRYFKAKNFHALIFVLIIILPIFSFYYRGMTTPKYLLYIYPAFSWLAIEGFIFLINKKSNKKSIIKSYMLVFLLVWEILLSGLNILSFKNKTGNFYHVNECLTHDGFRPITGIIFYPLKELNRKIRINRRIEKMVLMSAPKNTVFWVPWDYRGILNYKFTMEAESIESDGPSRKIYKLKNGRRARVIEIRLVESNLQLQDVFNNLYVQDYAHIFLINRPEVFYEISKDHLKDLKRWDDSTDPNLLFIQNKN